METLETTYMIRCASPFFISAMQCDAMRRDAKRCDANGKRLTNTTTTKTKCSCSIQQRTLELLMQSFLNQDEHAGPPPTSEEALKKLKQSKGKLSDVLRDVKAKQKKQAGSAGDGGKDGAGAGLKDADKLTCVVCREEFDEDGTDVVPLPCGHVFHEGCILPWLETNNTCPVCRFELPAAGGGGSGGGGTAATDAGNGGSGNGGSGGGGGGGGGTQNDNGEGSASGEGGGNSWFW